MADNTVRALVWDENPTHAPKEIYPVNIRGAVAEGLNQRSGGRIQATVAHLDEPGQGITDEALSNADVLLWWGHQRHGQVEDATAERVRRAVHEKGLGFIALHSAHYSKAFRQVIGDMGHLKGGWRELEPPEREEITVCAPKHPIAAGIEDFVLDHEEMYGAPFIVPPPAVLVFQSYFPHGGEYFPTGLVWTVGPGIDPEFTSGPGNGVGQGEGASRVFYFRPGHESVPTYYNETVQKILVNATLWAGHQGKAGTLRT